jgi:peptide/nickel transport system substrate-binding protein
LRAKGYDDILAAEAEMRSRRQRLPILTSLALLLVACTPQVVTVTVTSPPETVVVTATPSPSPEPPPVGPKVVNVCVVGEPDTLYLYGGSELPATDHVMEALYDGPIDHRGYAYQPVILEKLPSIGDGDAVVRTIYVRRGDRVVNVDDEVVDLADGVQVRPSGCYTTGCEVVFDGRMVRMDRVEATFLLREDVSWSDGEPLTAEDSEFAFEVASDSGTPGYRYLADRTSHYRALDSRRTKWIGVPGFVDASYASNFFPPLPRHQLENRRPSELPGDDDVRRAPLGWGPFIVDEWVRGDHLTVVRNPHYFRASEGLPYVDRLTFRFTADAAQMVTAVLSGECHLSTRDVELDTLLPLLMRAEDQGLVRVISGPGGEWEYLMFGIPSPSNDGGSGFLAQTDVRRAMTRCIDRQAIVEEIVHGHSVIPDSYLPPEHPLYPEGGLTESSYDPAIGRALLDELGWRDDDGDGVREARDVDGVSDGDALELTLLTASDRRLAQETARMVRAQLADCGVQVTIEAIPSWELLADAPEGPLFNHRFDLVEATCWLGEPPPCERYLSSQVSVGGHWGRSNLTGYSSIDYDAVCLAALQALPGTSDYERYHTQAQILFSQDLPALPLFIWPRVALAGPEVQNFQMDVTARSELWGIETLDLETETALP